MLFRSVFTDRPPRMTPTGAIVFTAGHVAATTNRRHHLQLKLSMSAADWFLHFLECMILPLVIGLIVFATGLLLLPPTRVHFITAMQLCHHGGATSFLLSSASANSIASTSPTMTTTRVSTPRHTSPNMMPCYFITTSGVPIFNIYLHSSNDYSTTRSYSSRLYVQFQLTKESGATQIQDSQNSTS